MLFFIDTANLDHIREAAELGILDGVTTNPSLMAKEGISGEKNILKHYRTICEIVGEDRDVSAEVISTDVKGIIAEGRKLAEIHPNIVVKVPMIKEGVKAISQFTEMGGRPQGPLSIRRNDKRSPADTQKIFSGGSLRTVSRSPK